MRKRLAGSRRYPRRKAGCRTWRGILMSSGVLEKCCRGGCFGAHGSDVGDSRGVRTLLLCRTTLAGLDRF